jgi:hypothetical protein
VAELKNRAAGYQFLRKDQVFQVFGFNFLPFTRKPDIEFVTALSIDDCKKRLERELQLRAAILGLHPAHSVIERLDGNRFRISRNQSFPFIDHVQPLLEGYLTNINRGTLVRASFRVNNGSLFAVLLLGFIVFFGVVANQVISRGAEWGLFLVPIVFFGFMGFAYWFLSWHDKSKREVLTEYLQRILTPDADLRK